MRIDYLSSDILLFRGDSLAALATAFVDGKRVLLLDALASEYDAIEMRDYLERDLGLTIERLILTHSAQGFDAGLHVFRGAHIDTAAKYGAGRSLTWGRHQLDFLPSVGGNADEVVVEAASGELQFVGDRIIGGIALLGERAPDDALRALTHLRGRGVRQLVPAHVGAQCSATLEQAGIYLRKLGVQVMQARARHPGSAVHAAIAAIKVDDCLADGVHAAAIERVWHADNLKRIAERNLFAAAPAGVRAEPPHARANKLMRHVRDSGVWPMLLCMLGRLGRSGV